MRGSVCCSVTCARASHDPVNKGLQLAEPPTSRHVYALRVPASFRMSDRQPSAHEAANCPDNDCACCGWPTPFHARAPKLVAPSCPAPWTPDSSATSTFSSFPPAPPSPWKRGTTPREHGGTLYSSCQMIFAGFALATHSPVQHDLPRLQGSHEARNISTGRNVRQKEFLATPHLPKLSLIPWDGGRSREVGVCGDRGVKQL